MDANQIGMMALTNLLSRLPLLLVCVVGGVVAYNSWDRAPRAAQLVLIGLGTLLIVAVVQAVATPLLLHRSLEQGRPEAGRTLVLSVVGFGLGLIHALALVPLIAAAFVGRRGSGSASED